MLGTSIFYYTQTICSTVMSVYCLLNIRAKYEKVFPTIPQNCFGVTTTRSSGAV